MIQKEPSLLDL